MARLIVILVLFAIGIGTDTSFAVPPGTKVSYYSGEVTFDGKAHADFGLNCDSCHPKIFEMKKVGGKITMAEMGAGKNCGACHDGKYAFNSTDAANCSKCHKK